MVADTIWKLCRRNTTPHKVMPLRDFFDPLPDLTDIIKRQ